MRFYSMRLVLYVALCLLTICAFKTRAGTCNCKPEIKNAKATVTTACAKIWLNNSCTLKETGASSSSSGIWHKTAYSALKRDEVKTWSSSDDWNLFSQNLFPRIADTKYLHGLILKTLEYDVPPEFARDVTKLVQKHEEAIKNAWENPDGIETISDFGLNAAISKHCFYADNPSRDIHFYINGQDKECNAISTSHKNR